MAAPLFETTVFRVSHVSAILVSIVLCLYTTYNSGIILAKIVTYYSYNYASILGASLIGAHYLAYHVIKLSLYQAMDR